MVPYIKSRGYGERGLGLYQEVHYSGTFPLIFLPIITTRKLLWMAATFVTASLTMMASAQGKPFNIPRHVTRYLLEDIEWDFWTGSGGYRSISIRSSWGFVIPLHVTNSIRYTIVLTEPHTTTSSKGGCSYHLCSFSVATKYRLDQSY